MGTRSSKPTEGTTITGEQFRAHFSKISSKRYESNPTDLHRNAEDTPDRRNDPRFRNAEEKLNEIPSFKEIEEAILEVKDSAPGADKVRMRYIWNATPELKINVSHLVKEMFATRTDKWEQSAKVGQIVALFKKTDRKNCGNYRGVCLLSMISRIIARVISKRLREWTEELNLLDENQSGIRPNRSTADATQVLRRIQKDMQFIKARRVDQNEDINQNTEPVGRLLDREKAHPRVSKPALWDFLKTKRLHGIFLHCIMDLYESTNYCDKNQHGVRSSWNPERDLREGCPTSPVLFNIFHQIVIEKAETKRRQLGIQSRKKVGIEWNWLPGGELPVTTNLAGTTLKQSRQTSRCHCLQMTQPSLAQKMNSNKVARSLRMS